MPGSFLPSFRDEGELAAHQLKGLQWTARHAYGGSDFYRGRMDRAGVKPEDIRTQGDVRRLPFTTADDLRDGYPFPLRAVPFERLVRIHSSSGTTGKRKVLCYTRKDIQDWTHFFARCYEMAGVGPGDRVQISVVDGLLTAGVSFQAGCEAVGAMAIPVGPGNLDMQCQFLVDLQPTVICCTASMALLLAEEVDRRGLRERIRVRTVVQGSERCSDAMRRRILDLLGADHLFDITGMTELYGPGAGLDCSLHQGIHYWADYYLLEVLDPESLEPVADGEIGEMVVTTLAKEGSPLIRYRTRDLTRLIPGRCACGSVLPRHDRILGRSDDMIIFRGVNIYPGQIDELLSQVRGVSSEYNIQLETRAGKDFMTVNVERDPLGTPEGDSELRAEIERRVRNQILASAEVRIVEYGHLPRSEKKSKRVYDERSG